MKRSAPYVSHMHVMGPEVNGMGHSPYAHKTLAIIAQAQCQAEEYDTGWGDYSVFLEKPRVAIST